MPYNKDTSPYYDDFDKTKKYLRMLFNPGKAVQARELTQIQTMLQDQLADFGKHVFKDGSKVLGGQTTLDTKVISVPVNIGTGDISDFIGVEIEDSITGAIGKVITVDTTNRILICAPLNGYNFEDNNAISSPVTENIFEVDGTQGTASIVSIDNGVYFTNDLFVPVTSHTYIIDSTSNIPTARIGLSVTSSIIDSDDDDSLLDPANGFNNYLAPGADRYKITLSLIAKSWDPDSTSSSDNVSSSDFIELMRISDGVLIKNVVYPIYSEIEKTLARRTYDESGNYTVRYFPIEIKEHPTNDSLLNIYIDPGKAYIFGQEFETIAPTIVTMEKGRDDATDIDNNTLLQIGNYVLVDNLVGDFNPYSLPSVTLYNPTHLDATLGENNIGTANVRGLEYHSGTVGTDACIYKMYLYNVQMDGTNSFLDVNSICIGQHDGTRANIVDADGMDGTNTTLFEPSYNKMLFRYPRNAIKRGITGISYERFVWNDITDADGTFDFELTVTGEEHKGINSSLSESNISEYYIVVDTATGAIIKPSGVDVGTTTATIKTPIETGGVFNVQTKINIEDTDFDHRNTKTWEKCETTIFNNPGSENIIPHTDILSLYGIYESADTTTDPKLPTIASVPFGTITKGDKLTSGTKIGYFVTTSSPYKIVTNDVFAVGDDFTTDADTPATGVITAFEANDMANERSAYYIFDNGQRDNYYDRGRIKLISGRPQTGRILVVYDYFSHSANKDYFTIDSYPSDFDVKYIPSYVDTLGKIYNLADCIDFRPDRDVSDGTSFNEHYIPLPNEDFISSYVYYLPRRDSLVLTSDRQFKVLKGISELNPKLPQNTIDSMTLYNFNIPAYTYYVRDIKTSFIENKRYTMRDVGKLEKRIGNLEYYTTLNFLEKNTNDMLIKDADGNDRFKNGILVDSFIGHNIGNVSNNDYLCSIDYRNNFMRSPFISKYFDSTTAPTDNNCQTSVNGEIVTLPYTTKALVNQPLASGSINVNPYNVVSWIGSMTISPAVDNWVDTEQRPAVNINMMGENDAWDFIGQALEDNRSPGFGTEWNDWENRILGETLISDITDVDVNVDSYCYYPHHWFYYIQRTITETNTQTWDVSNERNRTGVMTTFVPETITRNLGDRVVDISIIPFIRERTITAVCTGLKPSTTMYPYFDGTLVSAYCTPSGGNLGDDMTTDIAGSLTFNFTIPSNSTLKFRTGERILKICDSATE